jgi:hypothetical protein
MSFTDRKSKIVSFRLSEAEYEAIEEICRLNGFSSMAYFARSAILAFSSGVQKHQPLEEEIVDIRKRLDALMSAFRELGLAKDDMGKTAGSTG